MIKFIGDIFPSKVKAKGHVFNIEKSGDVFDVPEDAVEHLLKNKAFIRAGDKKVVKEEKKEEKKVDDVSYDLNNDGVVDKEDASIAGKVLYRASRNKD